VITAGVFTLVHLADPEYYWFAFVYAFMMGILLGTMFVRAGCLWYALGFHFAWNVLQSEEIFNVPERGGGLLFLVVPAGNFLLAQRLLPNGRFERSLDPAAPSPA
jgi:membrane protease YdiL (CAAX protease family)